MANIIEINRIHSFAKDFCNSFGEDFVLRYSKKDDKCNILFCNNCPYGCTNNYKCIFCLEVEV